MNTVTFKYPNGIKVKDTVSGITGTIIARSQKLNGSIRYTVQPLCKKEENTIPDAWNIDEVSIKPATKKACKSQKVTFSFNTGDRVENIVNGLKGIIVSRINDLNKCERYTVETKLDKKGEEKHYTCYVQELKKIDGGLNKKTKAPIKRKNTGGPSTKAYDPYN